MNQLRFTFSKGILKNIPSQIFRNIRPMTKYTRVVSKGWGKKMKNKRFLETGKAVIVFHSVVLLCGSPLLRIRGDWTGRWMPVEVRYQAPWV